MNPFVEITGVLSHMQCLVSLNRTLVGFPRWCGLFTHVQTQSSHSGADRNDRIDFAPIQIQQMGQCDKIGVKAP